jgi:hypothetical protein
MNSVRDILKQLQYHLSIRQIGKTTLLKVGVDDYPKYHCIVVPNIEYARRTFNPINKLHNFVSLNNLENLRGTNQPMIIDQEANLQLFKMVLYEFDDLDNMIRIKDNTITTLTSEKDKYYSDLCELKVHLNEQCKIRWWQFGKRRKYRIKRVQLLKDIVTN